MHALSTWYLYTTFLSFMLITQIALLNFPGPKTEPMVPITPKPSSFPKMPPTKPSPSQAAPQLPPSRQPAAAPPVPTSERPSHPTRRGNLTVLVMLKVYQGNVDK